jgi:hypothetical protein
MERGFSFDEPINTNNKDNMFVACQFGHWDMLKLLNEKLGMDIFRVKLDGESTLEYCLRRANFSCYNYVLDYYVFNQKLVKKNTDGKVVPIDDIPGNIFAQFLRIRKFLYCPT